jgi:hypothetical protein
MRAMRFFVELRSRWLEERTQAVDYDPNGTTHADGLTVNGVKIGVNTGFNGELYVRVTGGPTFTVSWYSATGASGLVAQGTATAGNTATMAEQNSSGLSGTHQTAAGIATEADDAHKITCYPDWRKDGLTTFDGTDTITGDDSKSLDAWYTLCGQISALQDQALALLVDFFVRMGITDTGNPVAQLAEWFKSDASALITHESQNSSDAITQLRRGLIEDMRQAMADETTGSTQYVIKRLMAAAVAVAGTNNTGTAAVAIHVPEDHCPAGTYKLRCVAGLGNEKGGDTEQFEVSFTPLAADENVSKQTLPDLLTINKSYQAPNGFGGLTGITMLRTRSKTGDGSNLHLIVMTDSSWSESGANESNTDSGVLYWKIVASAADFIYEFYSSSTRDSDTLVARSSAVAAATAFSASPRNNSGLTVNGTSGSAPVATTEGTINLKYHSVSNSAAKPDEYSIEVSVTSSGDAQRILAEVLGFKLNGAASGSETLEDGLLARANTFEPYVVKDN